MVGEVFMGNPNNPLSEAARILETEQARNLLSPLTRELGDLLGTVANLARFYATDNLVKIFGKWARSTGRTLGKHDFRKVMPLLPSASMVSDDELQDRWAALMESTATNDGCLPSFGQTLAQIDSEEARYLDRLWRIVTAPTDRLSVNEPLSYHELVRVFDPHVKTGVNPAEWKLFKERFTEDQKANYARFARAKLVIEDLIRLGIIHEDRRTEAPDYLYPQEEDKIRLELRVTSRYSISQYGVSFLRAVTVSCDANTPNTPTVGVVSS